MAPARTPRIAAIAGDSRAPGSDGIAPLIAAIKARHGAGLAAIVYYGSCFRDGDPYAGLVDFYVLVDSYRTAGQHWLSASGNFVLPPNVYYLERGTARGVLRCKYALLRMSQLEAGARRWFQSSIWGRFAQPVGLVYVRSDADRRRVSAACGEAVLTLLRRALPALPARLPPAQAFAACLALSYSGELRVETGARSAELVAGDMREYRRRLAAAAPMLPFVVEYEAGDTVRCRISERRRALARISWPARRAHGRVLSLLRLVKACFTFAGALDYGAWKLQRHTGIEIEVTPRLRRYPLVFGWAVLWRLYRQRKLR